MKHKALFMILLTAILITPVFAFIHPPPPDIPCETFAVKIEDEWCYSLDYAYEFHEPEDNFCDTFTVQVLAVNVTDLYGFEYKLHWDSTYFALVEIAIEQVWLDQLVVLNQTDSSWHKLVMVAKAPSTGVNDPNGGILLCTYTFHIVNDVCWPQGMQEGKFWITDHKMSDSCTQDLEPCTPIKAYWKFFPAEPEVYIQPKEDVNCVVGEEVTYEVWVHNITKMKSLYFDLRWNGHRVISKDDECTPHKDDVWLAILNLTEVVINEDVFPEANRSTDKVKIFNNPANKTSYVTVEIVMECTFPLINGTVKAVDLIFEKMDPWWCGRQPHYDIDLKTHEMKPDNATTPLWFEHGYIDVMCPEKDYITFGKRTLCKDYGATIGTYAMPSYTYTKTVGWVSSPPNDFLTLQGAISWAVPGDVITVNTGTYAGFTATGLTDIVIYPWAGPVTINGAIAGSLGSKPAGEYTIKIEDCVNFTLDSLNIEGSGWDATKWNGGVCYVNSTGSMLNCYVSSNTIGQVSPPSIGAMILDDSNITIGYSKVDDFGRIGVYMWNASVLHMHNTEVIGQTYTGIGDVNYGVEIEGAATFGGSAWTNGCEALIENCKIHGSDNTYAPDPTWSSAGIVWNGWMSLTSYDQTWSNVTITHCDIYDNYFGIEVINGRWSSVDDCAIYDNRKHGVISEPSWWGQEYTFMAEKNWWGHRLGPGVGGANDVSGKVDYIPWISCCLASYNEAKFTFMPVPGDLTGDGIVNIKDLTAIASKYCLKWSCAMDTSTPAGLNKFVERYYYDFNKDGHIDIFDIIVVSKNWEATCPF